MPKTLISLLFTIIFALLFSGPTIISILDKDLDVSMFYSLAEEEEEENSKESVKLISFELNAHNDISYVFSFSEIDNSFIFYLKTYSQLYLENVSPPPKSIA